MTKLRKILTRAALAAAVIGGTAAVTASPASARVVCDRFHCWHVYRHYGPYYDDPYYDPYYYPSYYGPGVTFGFNFGGGGHHFRGGSFHGGGFHGGSGFHGHHH